MDCKKLDLLMMVLVTVVAVALIAMYVFVVPVAVVLFGMAAQCAVEDPFGRFAAFAVSMLMSAFIGYNIANLVNDCREKEKNR